MSSRNHPNRDSGIHYSLPQFDPSLEGLTAIITGAWGISGFGTLRALLDSPQRWSKIYTVSRSKPPPQMLELLSPDSRSRIEHVCCDLLENDSAAIAAILKKAGVSHADYIFFYSYLQPAPEKGGKPWSNDEQLVKVNSGMLGNFLGALPQANIKPRRFLLQTGAKNYGLHIGRVRLPCIESDPQPKNLAPNFYYPQEDQLFSYCKKNGVGWNVIRPAWVIGATTSAAMTPLYPFAVYAAVAAERNQPLIFNGDWSAWQDDYHFATSSLTGYLSEWAVLEEKCHNEAFNSQDTSPVSWDRLWEELVRWFGVKDGVPPKEDEIASIEWTTKGGKDTPMGYGPPIVTRFTYLMLEWAKDPENAKAWRAIMKRDGLTYDPFSDVAGNFTFADAAYPKTGLLSMNKVCWNKFKEFLRLWR